MYLGVGVGVGEGMVGGEGRHMMCSFSADIGIRLLVILLPTVNGLGLIVLAFVVVLFVVIRCRQKKFEGSKYERKHSTVQSI